jgi:predicted amidohydrolase
MMGDTFPKFKAAAVQASPVFLDRDATIEKACDLMMEASQNGAKLVAFPETWIPGYPYWIWIDTPIANFHFLKRLFEESIEVPSRATEALCAGAKEADVYVVMGINEKVPTQMGTIWNTNILIDNEGKILGKHRKLVPTFAEKMVWSRGDGSGLRVWETDLGRIGTLACGNNTHPLYKYALLAQGEQIHVANYPAFYQQAQVDMPMWIRIRSAAQSLEGKTFTVTSTSTINNEMVEMLSGKDQKKKKWLKACRAYSCINNPVGDVLAELDVKDGIIYADVDLSDEIAAKQYHDVLGHYTRLDVVSLNLCQDEDRPVWLNTKIRNTLQTDVSGLEFFRQFQEGQQDLMDELRRAAELISQSTDKIEKAGK